MIGENMQVAKMLFDMILKYIFIVHLWFKVIIQYKYYDGSYIMLNDSPKNHMKIGKWSKEGKGYGRGK